MYAAYDQGEKDTVLRRAINAAATEWYTGTLLADDDELALVDEDGDHVVLSTALPNESTLRLWQPEFRVTASGERREQESDDQSSSARARPSSSASRMWQGQESKTSSGGTGRAAVQRNTVSGGPTPKVPDPYRASPATWTKRRF